MPVYKMLIFYSFSAHFHKILKKKKFYCALRHKADGNLSTPIIILLLEKIGFSLKLNVIFW